MISLIKISEILVIENTARIQSHITTDQTAVTRTITTIVMFNIENKKTIISEV